MQVDIEKIEHKSFISAFGTNYVSINKKKYKNLIFYSMQEIIGFEKVKSIYDKIILEKLDALLKFNEPDLILFGSGKSFINLPNELKKLLIDNKRNFEVMTSISAYSTHNVLISEKRNIISIIKLV